MGVRVKICGVTLPADAELAAALGADMIGLNFYAGSRRYLDPAKAHEVVEAIPNGVWKVGVFVNASRAEIEDLRSGLGLDAVQFHGDEGPEALSGWSCPVIRALRISGPADAARALASDPADYYLCEGLAGGGYGGGGETFDWTWARDVPSSQLIVAGGLRPENVARAVRQLRPYAVDVASGVESDPGIKDPEKVRELIENAKSA